MSTPTKFNLSQQGVRKVKDTVDWVDLRRLNLDGDPTGTQDDGEKFFLALTVATSGTEYTDERYTVQRAYLSNSGDSATTMPTITAYTSGQPLYTQVTAKNLGESGTHGMAVGTPVLVFHDYDATTSPNPIMRYVIVGAFGGGATTPIKTLSPGSGTTAATDTWTRTSDKEAVNIDMQTREVWDGTGNVLYYFTRLFTYDSAGELYSISAETQHTTDIAVSCS